MAVGIVGAGTMGAGIASLAAAAGYETLLCDANGPALERGLAGATAWLERRAPDTAGTLQPVGALGALADCALVVEAVPEDAALKTAVLAELATVAPTAVLASNTSSISIAALARDTAPERVVGLHFFNPATRMPLVELVRTAQTGDDVVEAARAFAQRLGKEVVAVADAPGFLVNRCARPFYLEALRIVEDGAATPAAVDRACCERGGFPMGPFELMDLIGLDVGLGATRAMWAQGYGEPRWRPSSLQVRMVNDGRLGVKADCGGFYAPGTSWRDAPATADDGDGDALLQRIVAQLVNEAWFAVADGVAEPVTVDRALELGLRHPRGPFAWMRELGAGRVVAVLDDLWAVEHDGRYRIAPALRRHAAAAAA